MNARYGAQRQRDDPGTMVQYLDFGPVGGEPVSLLCRLRTPGGSFRWVELKREPIQDAYGPARFSFAGDVPDDGMRTNKQSQAIQATLENASRLSTVAELSASIAHEISQPLSAIVANSAACNRWLTADPPNVARAKQTMSRIARDAQCVSEIVERIRALYRHESPSLVPLDLNTVVREARDLLREESARAHVSVSMELNALLPLVMGDRVQLQQVLTNLVRNAIDAMKSSAVETRTITLSTEFEGPALVRLAVVDVGPGFSNHQRAFEPFYTTKASGMGMGLAICRSIVEAHGGTISARNMTPHGACVQLSLPRASAK